VSESIQPNTAEDLQEAVRWAAGGKTPLEVVGGGSKRAFGRPCGATHHLDISALAGITLYEPEELVLGAQAGTPLAHITAALAENRQQLAFEPPDLGPLLGAAPDSATLGGIIACNLAGPRRLSAGAARDHILGFHAVSGRGEMFKSGGRVVKNVTGFDLGKLMCGSFGTLAVMTEVTVKVLPAAEETSTVRLSGLTAEDAVKAMGEALRTPHEVSGAAHLTPEVTGGTATTLLRVEGPGPSVEYRCEALRRLLAPHGDIDILGSRESRALWRQIRDVDYFVGEPERPVWRVSVPPMSGAAVAAAIGGRVFLDWGGGLLWVSLAPSDDAGHEAVRAAIAEVGGHATLVRAPEAVRAAVPVFQPQPAPLAALAKRIKGSFDPDAILNPGRMVEGV
jgi:glycolate oxidase FAD binding subunit